MQLLGSIYGPQRRSEEFHKGKALIVDAIAISVISVIVMHWARSLGQNGDASSSLLSFDASESEINTTGFGSPSVRLALALLQTAVLWGDIVLVPAPRRKEDPELWNALSLNIGHFCYFTGQSLIFQTIYQWFSFFAVFFRSRELATAVNLMSQWVMTQSLLLTIAFLALNWGEKRWQTIYRPKMEKTYPHFGYFMLIVHTPNLVFSVVDFFLVQNATSISRFGPTVKDILLVGLVYGMAYASLLFATYDLTGFPIYPFVVRIDTKKKRMIFSLVMTSVFFVFYQSCTFLRNVF